jgi:molybdate transport system substrate-binding protein
VQRNSDEAMSRTAAVRWHALAKIGIAVITLAVAIVAWVIVVAPPTTMAVVAAASDLQFALPEVVEHFAADTGERVELVFGASGTLMRQLLDGAPFELFMAADESFVFRLADEGLTRDRGVIYAEGRVALFAPTGSPLRTDARLDGLRALIDSGKLTRFAIANPAVAPYGRAAEAVLRTRGLWDAVQPYLVLGDNAARAAQFARSGDAVGGLLPHSLVLAPPMRDSGTFTLLAAADHPPLRQRMVLMARAGATAAHFYEYVRSRPARTVLARHGFEFTDR